MTHETRIASTTTMPIDSTIVQYSTFPVQKYSRERAQGMANESEQYGRARWEHMSLQPLSCRFALHDAQGPQMSRAVLTIEWKPDSPACTPVILVRRRRALLFADHPINHWNLGIYRPARST